MLQRIILNYKDLNARWLITGEGEMLEETSGNAVSEPSMVYGKDLFQLYTDEVRKNGMLEQKLRDLTGYGDDLKLGGAVTATSQRRPRGTARGRAG
jgi:hypothetical protein